MQEIIPGSKWKVNRNERRKYVLSHNSRQTYKLQHVACDKQEGVENFFFLTCGTTPSKNEYKQRQDAEEGEYQVEYVERRFPELLLEMI
jgi:hypothetical protein